MFMHEIKNPLNTIYGIAQLLPISTNAEVQQCSDMIIQSIDNIKNIEREFDIYRKTGKFNIKYDAVDVSKLIYDIIDEYRAETLSYGVNIIYKHNKATVFTDTIKLRQSISNLLSNAIKYGSVKEKNNKVKITCYNEDLSTIITITDNGIGMTSSELAKVGNPFYRSKTIDRPGTGLGISIVKKFAKLLNWDFAINSAKNKGTAVRLTIT